MEMIKPTGTQSVYLWAGFGICGVTDIIFIDGRLDGATYVETLKQGLIPFLQKHHISNDSYLLLDDNSRIRDCTIAQNFKTAHSINMIECPGWSPDLNPIENLWSILKRRVNSRNPQSIDDLKKYIVKKWEIIGESDILKNLIQSIPKRIREMIRRKGDKTKY